MKFALRLVAAFLVLGAFCFVSVLNAQKRRTLARYPIGAKNSGLRPTVSASPGSMRRVETFLKVWSALRDNYFDPTFNNLDWNKIKTEFEPKARAAKTDGELHILLDAMIGRLQRSHLAIIPPDVYQTIERAKVEAKAREVERSKRLETSGRSENDTESTKDFSFDDPLTQYGIGVDLRLLENRFVITRIRSGSASEYAGLKTGYVIDKINGVSLSELLRRIEIQNINSARIKKYLPLEIVASFLNGEKDSLVSITYLDENDYSKEIAIRRERLKSQTITLGRSFPDRQLEFEMADIGEDVGYIRFNFFAMPVIGKFCDAVGRFSDKKAVIIDLRGNMGGILATMIGLGGMLTNSSLDLGTSIYKTGTEALTANSKAKNFRGKLAFIVDNQTVSAAEIFAASVQDGKRAILVGDRTAGEALPSIALDLPTGAVLLYPIANYRSPSGKYLEGIGVGPDIAVSLTRKSLLIGRDEQLEAALLAIKDEKVFERLRQDVVLTTSVGRDAPPPPTGSKIDAISPTEAVLKSQRPASEPPRQVKAPLNSKDGDSINILRDFANAIGGEKAIQSLNSYVLSGKADLLVKGTSNQFDFKVYYENPGRYTEEMTSKSSGEIREVHNGNIHFVQTDYGLTRDIPVFADTGDRDILAPIRSVADPLFYRSLSFVGDFDREGRKVAVIDARTRDGFYMALAFDRESKLLVSFTGSYYAMNFSDYRKTGGLMLPFKIERERVMNVVLDEVTVNAPIAEQMFSKKLNCFDKDN